MKKFRFPSVLFSTAMALLLASCGANEAQPTPLGPDTTPSAMASATMVSSPENMMIAKHKVADFNKWLDSYDAHDSLRLANGIHSYVVGRGMEDSNTVIVGVKVDDMDKAKAFAKDARLKQAMQQSGVVGTPSFRFVTLVVHNTAKNSSAIRSWTTFTVKDFDAWKKEFESHRQARMDNGISDRGYGYDAGDPHKVNVIVALDDTAKARTFWKSDLLKQQIAKSGVIGQPQRFVFRVVKRY